MPVPTLITQLDTAAANNSPPGTESARGNIDDYLRAHASFIRQVFNGAQSGSYAWAGTAGGTANALTLTLTPAITAYSAGQRFVFKSGASANSGVTTAAVSGLTPLAVQVNGAACAGGEIAANTWYEVLVDASLASCQLNKMGIDTAASSRVKGLIGAPNAVTPLTKYDLSADEVVLRNANGGTVTRYLTGTITNDLGLAGSAANGRDQSAAFTASSWIYLYFIWNGTTLATVSSTAVPTTGPTLPTGYTHWSFATALRWNASSNIIPMLTKGCTCFYDIANGGVVRVLIAGQATTLTAVSFAGFVPPNVLHARFNFILSVIHSAIGTDFSTAYRPTGSAIAGIAGVAAVSQVSGLAFLATAMVSTPLGTSQQIDYKIATVPSGGGGLHIDILDFKIPNGDS